MLVLQFADRIVTYERFLTDVSAYVARVLRADRQDPEFISQRKAFEMFGRGNVQRWRRQGKVEIYKRPGKVEYRTADLRVLQLTVQDYFDVSPKSSDK